MRGLKTIAKLREINNYSDMSREELIYTLLRSEKAPEEDNYLNYLSNSTNSNLKRRINDARILTAKLGNVLTNKQRKTIQKELYDLENKKNTKITTEKAITHLIKLKNTLESKLKNRYVDHRDQAYYGIEDIEHLINDDIDDYYTPILVRSSFENNFG